MSQRTNLILLTIDAWRPDFVDQYAGVGLAPALERHRAHTVRFANAFANAPWTSPALVSLFSGRSSAQHGVHFEWSRPQVGGPSLAGNLISAGWHAPNLCYLNRLANYQHLGYALDAAPEPPAGPDDPILWDAIANTPEPFFLWFHYKFVHLPYTAPGCLQRALGLTSVPERLASTVGSRFVVPRHEFPMLASDRDIIRRMYAAGVLRMNDWLSQVFDALEERGVGGRTSMVLTSDHGEELMEHGHVGHASTAHNATLYDEVLRVPLLVIDPRVRAPRTLHRRVQGMDLFPTLHLLAGVTPPPCLGVDLTPAVLGETEPELHPNRLFYFRSARMGCPTPLDKAGQYIAGVSDGRQKIIVERYDEARTFCFDLMADPDELEPRPLPEGALVSNH